MLRRHVSEPEIPVYDIQVADDKRNAGYNIGDLLNMPYLSHQWPANPHANADALARMNLIAKSYPDSILDIYCNGRTDAGEPVPNIERIRESVSDYYDRNSVAPEIMKMVEDPTTICVHVRTGDMHLSNEYIRIIRDVVGNRFRTVIILGGLHLDEYFVNIIGKRQNFANGMNRIMADRANIFLYMDKADNHLCLMMRAKNFLVHRGGFSCLGSIVCNGNLFITNEFNHAGCENWQRLVGKKYELLL